MTTLVHPTRISTSKRFSKLPVDCLTRDQTQSDLLHEPKFRISNIDPISGEDVTDANSRPSLKDGNLTMYFQTEETREKFISMPLNHPSVHLSFAATVDDDRGG